MHVYIRLKMNNKSLLCIDLESYQNLRKDIKFIIKNYL